MIVSRQVRRQQEREASKVDRASARNQSRTEARRERLQRQSDREKSGFYEGRRSVAAAVAPSRSRITKRIVSKGKPFGRHIRKTIFLGVECALHATKGWRAA